MVEIHQGESLFVALQQKGMKIQADCGGRHHCGKCKIKVEKSSLPYSKKEKELLREEEIAQQIHLACFHESCEQSVWVSIPEKEERFQIEGIHTLKLQPTDCGYVAGVDIGTTTMVVAIYEGNTGNCVWESRFLNPQRSYGADVIARIDACRTYGVATLQRLVLEAIEAAMIKSSIVIERMCVCGNATMTHIFMGIDPWPIGQAPYTCPEMNLVEKDSKSLFPQLNSFVVQILPPLSAFVGSDIVMGMYALQFPKQKTSLLLDLGTNGEMVLYNHKQKHCIASSSACGPAFEGGQMQCGMGAVAGAIQKVWFDEKWHWDTIEQKTAIGICGSGYISWITELLKTGILEAEGYLNQEAKLNDFLYLTQKDIREFQLAKSAMCAAMQTLLQQEQLHWEEVECIYLAGGFSSHLAITDGIQLGLFPSSWEKRIEVVGNTAIRGICQFAIIQDKESILALQQCQCITLTQDTRFTDNFMNQMFFKKIEE